MPTLKYVPFGRYFIDHHRINDDILSLRRGNGVNIVGLPVRRLSKDLGEVVRTIVKNEHPSYNQIDKLTKEEKDYLHKIAKSSNILDRLHIPSPTKEEDDQDINQFDIHRFPCLHCYWKNMDDSLSDDKRRNNSYIIQNILISHCCEVY